jgi:hypothetical protein
MTEAASPLTEPTERSISPSSRISTTPMAMIPIGAANSEMFTSVREDRNVGSWE